MKTHWSFSIAYFKGEEQMRLMSNGLQLKSPDEVESIGDFLEIDVSGRGNPKAGRVVRIDIAEDDPKLSSLLERLENDYGAKPSPWFIIPLENRDRFFGVRKIRKYSKADFDDAIYLHLDFAEASIAAQADGTEEQVERETYTADADEMQDSDVQYGTLMPFHGLCVAESLGQRLLETGLKGLVLDLVNIVPEQNARKPLRKPSSSLIAPRTLLRVVNEQGHEVEPNTEWPCYLDDSGYHPHEFRYHKSDLGCLQQLDIAMSYERTGVTRARSFRWCLVSQRFRQVMEELKVPGVRYVPVRFID